jgi:hypothetical protein
MINDTILKKEITNSKEVLLNSINIEGENFYQISNSDQMRPFFMSIVSESNHWMFIASNGGLTAGRKNAEFSLFPYYTDDKITESTEVTGSKSIFKVIKNGEHFTWEPFSIRNEGKYNISQNLYKNKFGNKIIFEEINHDLELIFSYQWNSSNQFGFVRKSKLINTSSETVSVELLDGVQNILPASIGSDIQNASSNLVDAYKRNELHAKSGLGIYALSAILVDKAEASEALKANVVWSLGLENPKYLVSSLQLNNFRAGDTVTQEEDVKAEKGAYFLNSTIELSELESKEWVIVADVNKDHSDVALLIKRVQENKNLLEKVNKDVQLGTEKLIALSASSDALQLSEDNQRDARHYANTLFNIMRGGIFDDNYNIEKWDFKKYLLNANKEVAKNAEALVNSLSEIFTLENLKAIANSSDDKDFKRLCFEYLPLKFSRRHGDPSRPWNKFSINTVNEEDGSKILDYEGNWRDIFQNWESLAHSYPEFIESMIHKFLNATTFDGYNPYRVTKGGFDWEVIEPDDPWSYIGYWGDHQIIYLLKFLEFIQKHQPGQLENLFNKDIFVYANVPYKIKAYEDLLANPKDTIVFNEEADEAIRANRNKIGADGALLEDANGNVVRANFMEKILATALAKLSNFIPEGGIWMNTQRPEWNDANNALVGNGVSMVTLYYLRRFLQFFEDTLSATATKEITISEELLLFFDKVFTAFQNNKELLASSINNNDKKKVLDALGYAGSYYRETIYKKSFSGRRATLSLQNIKEFVRISKGYLEHAIRANKRKDNLYHAYNLMTVTSSDTVEISYLYEMLEGQVAALSSGYLSSKEVLDVLNGMKASKLFRPDQYSYLLYPNKELKGFLDRNNIPKDAVQSSELLTTLLADGNIQIVKQDVNGAYHFNGNFKNAEDLSEALDKLSKENYGNLLRAERQLVLEIFEEVFNHKAFTGRSGTFYGYEGLGSIYWHMVSKLLLAVQECCTDAINNKENPVLVGQLLEHFYEINEGIGVHKSPSLYGAFPTDPYSHTPFGKGAQQPGMTGQVKEDILSRFGELGVYVLDGKLCFYPCLLRKNEFIKEAKDFQYVSLTKEKKTIRLAENSLAFTYCQVPVIYKIGATESLEIKHANGNTTKLDRLQIDEKNSATIFKRTGDVEAITVTVNESLLK